MQQQDVQNTAAAQAALFDRYGEVIFAYVRGHTYSREDAEDITLEVFIAALGQENLLTRGSDTEQLAWLKRVARNKLVDYYRRAKRRPAVSLDQFTEMMLDEEAAPEEVVLLQEEHGELHRHVKSLSQLQQQILRLRYGDGLRCSEIATLLNKRESAVRQLLSRTIRVLRSMYQDQLTGKGEDA
jgi:RNA polymerase sigma factor (sigma-70 family)